jgi:hypothetical protein
MSSFRMIVWLPLKNWTEVDHLNNRLVQYSDGYCTYTQPPKYDISRKGISQMEQKWQ